MIRYATYILILLHFLRMLLRRALSTPLAGRHGGNGSPDEFTCKVAFFYRMKADKDGESYVLFATVFSLNTFAIRDKFIKFLLKYLFDYSGMCCLDINDDPSNFLKNHSLFKQMQIAHGTILTYPEWLHILHDIESRFFSDLQNGTYHWDDIAFDTEE